MRSRWLRYPVLLSPLGATAWLAGWNDSASLNWRVGLIAVLFGLLVWLGSYGRGYICLDGRLKTVLMWIGSRSYAIYLIHISAYLLVGECFWRLGMAGNPLPPTHHSFMRHPPCC